MSVIWKHIKIATTQNDKRSLKIVKTLLFNAATRMFQHSNVKTLIVFSFQNILYIVIVENSKLDFYKSFRYRFNCRILSLRQQFDYK